MLNAVGDPRQYRNYPMERHPHLQDESNTI